MSIHKKFCVYAVLVIAVLTSVVAFQKNQHDLIGTYYSCEFFPVSSITFSSDGTFTAYNEYETLQGKYTKKSGKYSLQFTAGESKSSNPISNYEASSAGSQYGLEAEKISNDRIRVYVIPKISYWAWNGKYAEFISVN